APKREARAWSLEPGDDRAPRRLRRRRSDRSPPRSEESRSRADRGLDDRRQWRSREVPRGSRPAGVAPGPALARTLAADRGSGRSSGRAIARGAGRRRAGDISLAPAPGQPGGVSRSLAERREADWPG